MSDPKQFEIAQRKLHDIEGIVKDWTLSRRSATGAMVSIELILGTRLGGTLDSGRGK